MIFKTDFGSNVSSREFPENKSVFNSARIVSKRRFIGIPELAGRTKGPPVFLMAP